MVSVGVDAAGTAALGNLKSGVVIFNGATSNIIGGSAPAASNTFWLDRCFAA